MKTAAVSTAVCLFAISAISAVTIVPGTDAPEQAQQAPSPAPRNYIVIRGGGTIDAFTAEVNRKLAEGYSPVGGISVFQNSPGIFYTQAMMK